MIETHFPEYNDLEINPILLLIENLGNDKIHKLYKYYLNIQYSNITKLRKIFYDDKVYPIIILIFNLSYEQYRKLYKILIKFHKE